MSEAVDRGMTVRERERLLHRLEAALWESATIGRRWWLLAEAGKALASTRDPAAAIAEVAHLLVPETTDCFALYLSDDEHLPTLFEVRPVDGARGAELEARLRALLAASGDGAASGAERPLDVLVEAVHRAVGTGAAENSGAGAGAVAARAVLEALSLDGGTVVPIRVSGRCVATGWGPRGWLSARPKGDRKLRTVNAAFTAVDTATTRGRHDGRETPPDREASNGHSRRLRADGRRPVD
ncbi:MAG: hypothetical protein ACJ79S_00245 [Gemmatimonadaceae bacterium]